MQTVSCPRCKLSLLSEPETAGQEVECPECKARFKMPPMPPTPPVIDAVSVTAKRAKGRLGGLFGQIHAYRERCGWRSFVLQAVLVSWTVAVGLVFLACALDIASPSTMSRLGAEQASQTLVTGFLCFGAGWFLLAFPLALAAICLFGADKR